MKRITELLAKAHCRLLNNQKGASMIEYALVVGAVAGTAAIVIGPDDASAGLMLKIKTFVDAISLG